MARERAMRFHMPMDVAYALSPYTMVLNGEEQIVREYLGGHSMGVLSDIIIADPSEAGAINKMAGSHLKHWPCLESKGIDTIKLGTLSQILNSRSLDDVDTVARFMMDRCLDEASEDGPWVYDLPPELASSLASLDNESEEAVAE